MRQLKITKQITSRDSRSLEKYLYDISKIDLITAEEEVELARRIADGDQKALNQLVNANLRFVVSVAKQYQNRGLRLSDLINEGNIGLVKAAKRFDEKRGFKFISYAVWWIRQSILQAISEKSRVIRLPQNKIGHINKIYKAYSTLEQTHERDPSTEEIARELDLSISQVESTMKNTGRQVSMDEPFRKGESSNLYDVIGSRAMPKPDQQVMDESLLTDIEKVLETLPDKESTVIRLYYGIGEQPPMSLVEIGEKFELTRERVRQIKKKGIRLLKNRSRSQVLRPYL